MKLKPTCKDYLWGRDRLIKEYNKDFDSAPLADTWELSCHPGGTPSSSPARTRD